MTHADTKIAIFIPSLRGGGAERVMVTLANECARRGYTVDLVLVNDEGPYRSEVAPHVNIVNLNRTRVLTSLPGLARYLRQQRPAALLSAMQHVNIIAVIARQLSRVTTRIIVSERNKSRIPGKDGLTLESRLAAWAYRKADEIIAVSTGVAEDLSRRTGIAVNDIHVVFNPVVGDRLRYLAAQPLGEEGFRLPPGPLIVAMGRLTEQKDFSTLIKAFSQVRATRNVALLILGEGELRASLEAEVAHLGVAADVTMPGFVDNPFPILGMADLFVLSSRWEGLPNALIQAMACGTPVVSTDCPAGPQEILEGGRWGRLVPVGDVAAMAQAINATLDEAVHPAVRSRAEEFSVERGVNRYLEVMLPVNSNKNP